MAIVNCKECKKEISSHAKACPHCGIAVKSSNWLLYIVLIIGFILWGLGSSYEKYALQNPINMQSQIKALNEQLTEKCTPDNIKIYNLKTKFKNFCRSSDCIALTGTVSIENTCNEPVGVQVKVIAYDKNNNVIQVNELWPASIRNIPIGTESFSTDHWIEYNKAIETINVTPVRVKVWRK